MLYVFLSACLLGSALSAAVEKYEICDDIKTQSNIDLSMLTGTWYEVGKITVTNGKVDKIDNNKCTKMQFDVSDDKVKVVNTMLQLQNNKVLRVEGVTDVLKSGGTSTILDFLVNSNKSENGHIILKFAIVEKNYIVVYNCPPRKWAINGKRYAAILSKKLLPSQDFLSEVFQAAQKTMIENGPKFTRLNLNNCRSILHV